MTTGHSLAKSFLNVSILEALMSHGHLDRPELTRAVPLLPRGMPGHYILRNLEEEGLIKSRLPNRNVPARIYQIEELGKKALLERERFPAAFA